MLKRSISFDGRKTSVSLEDEFWTALKDMAAARRMAVNELIAEIDRDRQRGNLSSCLRIFVLNDVRVRCDAARRAQPT